MNTSYRSIWNHALGAWVAVSELTRSRGKRASGAVVATALFMAAGGAAAQDHTYTTAADAGPLSTSPAGVNPLGITLTTTGIAATQSSVVSGALGVIKAGPGTLTLSGANTYAGGTYLDAGTLRIGADNNLGAATGGLAFNGGTLAFSTAGGIASGRAISVLAGGATFDAAGTAFNKLGGPISGAGTLRFVNSAPYVPANEDMRFSLGSSNNTGFTGVTQVGTVGGVGAPGRTNLEVTGTGALGTGPVFVDFNSEVAFRGAAANANNLNITVRESSNELGSNSGVAFDAGGNAGNATFTTNGVGAYVSFSGGSSAGQATIVSNGGRVRFDDTSSGGTATVNSVGGLVRFTGNGDMSGLSVASSSGGTVVVAGSTAPVSLGSLSGSGSVVLGSQQLTVGALNQSSTFSGVISDTGPQVSDKNGSPYSAAVTATGGKLVKVGTGTLTLTGANTYSGGTAINGGVLQVGADTNLGAAASGLALAGGTLRYSTGFSSARAIALGAGDGTFDTNGNTATLSGVASGTGGLAKAGAGTLIVSGANNYTGATNVAQGTLRAGAVNTFSAASAHTVASGGILDTAGFNQTVASLNNSGTVSLVGAAPGSTLTVNGNYVGNGGVLRLGTVLGDSSSASDRLVLNGGTATGNTSIQITQQGGLGAQTTGDGINLITAQNGATTAANAFTLAGGHVDAGAFEYRLFDGDASGAGENWYLRSTTNVVTPPVDPGTPATPVDPGTPATPTPTPPATRLTYRAEVPLYSALPAILRQGDLAMLSTLHRRVGDESTFGSNASSAAVPNTNRAWGRLLGGNTTVTQNGTTSPESRTSFGGFQTGVDLYANPEWNAGLYVGKLRSDADVRGVYGLNLGSAYAGGLRADTTYLGGYATYANANGLYVDTVLQYGIQDITGRSANALGATADGKSLTASIEAGQRFAMGANWAIEPQVQLIYNRQNLDSMWIGGLTTVDQDTANAVIGRLGVRMTGDFSTSMGRLQPYARVNLWHGFSGTDTTSFRSPAAITNFDNRIGYTSVEVAAGATLALTPSTSVYGEVGSLAKAGGQSKVKSSIQGSLGVKVRF